MVAIKSNRLEWHWFHRHFRVWPQGLQVLASSNETIALFFIALNGLPKGIPMKWAIVS